MSDYLKEYMKRFETVNEGEKQLKDQAERIYLRFQRKEERIDSNKAKKQLITLTVSRWDKNWRGKEVRKERKDSMSLADWWANSYAHYAQDRGSIYDWQTVAGNLVHAYEGLDSYGCLISGKDELIKKLQDEVAGLGTKLQETEKKAGDFEKRFLKANDKFLETDQKLAECRKELADIRGHDISDSMKHGAGTINQDVSDEEDDNKD